MNMRGVFLCALLVTVATSVAAAEVEHELTGSVGTHDSVCKLSIDFLENWSYLDLRWGLDLNLRPTDGVRVDDRWQIRALLWDRIDFIVNHNLDHYTTSDRFRLINKNNYSEETYSVGVYTDQMHLGFLKNVPLKNLDSVDALFCSSELHLRNLLVKTLQLRFAGRKESGVAHVIEGIASWGYWKLGAALGSQTNGAGVDSQGSVLELKREGRGFETELVLHKIDPGFLSPLAKSNKYTPNRVGWQFKTTVPLAGLDVGFNIRRQTNLDRTRKYPQRSWEFSSVEKNTSLEWRLEPNPAFILRYSKGDNQVRVDPLNYSFRYDTKLSAASCSMRFDGERMIARLEIRFENLLDWRAIGKYDFLTARSHYSVMVRYGDDGKYLQIDIGEYDRGSMTSGFSNPFSFCITWGWKF
ncbi:MAG: hypothetical protein GX971_06740 [Firmicutes bacterium]|nr:hypothetical protein [Bacillota bacterium]